MEQKHKQYIKTASITLISTLMFTIPPFYAMKNRLEHQLENMNPTIKIEKTIKKSTEKYKKEENNYLKEEETKLAYSP